MYEVISFSLLKYRSQHATNTAIVNIIFKAIQRFRNTFSSPYSSPKQD